MGTGIKFFKKSYLDIDFEGASVGTTSGGTRRNAMRSRSPYGYWASVGSDDTVTETITGTFEEAKTLSRVLLLGHNFKQFVISYFDGAGWVELVSETACAVGSSYYTFAAVTTLQVRIEVLKTQTANEEKRLNQLIATHEIGTLTGYPVYTPAFIPWQVKKQTARGKAKFTIFDELYACTLNFGSYGVDADHQLMQTLWDSREDFLIYPCGGVPSQFAFDVKGNRVQDIFLVWFDSEFSPAYTRGVYALGLNYLLKLVEVA